MAQEKPVYSTDKSQNLASAKPEKKSIGPALGPCKIRLETHGRGGKKVTVVFNLPFTETQSLQHLKTLQGKLGTGGTYKDGALEFRGDVRDRVEAYFAGLQIKTVRAGG